MAKKGPLQHIFGSFLDSVRDIIPVVLVIAFFQFVVIQQPLKDVGSLLVGLLFVVVGLTLFVQGLQKGLFPLGEELARDFSEKGDLFWLISFAFALGFGTTVAEPALIAVAEKAAQIAAEGGAIAASEAAQQSYAKGLRYTVGVAVGVALIIGVLRILRGWPLHLIIIVGYLCVVLMTSIAPSEIIGIAYDSGGVTTSTLTVPLVAALGIGLASTTPGRNPVVDGFGMIAFASLTPIIFVMAYGMVML